MLRRKELPGWRHLVDDPVGRRLRGRSLRHGAFVQVRQVSIAANDRHLRRRQAMLRGEPRAPGSRELRQGPPQILDPVRIDLQRGQVGLREVSVILCELLAALRESTLLRLGPAARLLLHSATRLDELRLAVHLIENRAMQRTKRVDVLQLCLDPELTRTLPIDGHVGFGAQLALLHVCF